MIPFRLIFSALAFILVAGCSTAPVTRSAMGTMPISSEQLLFESIEVVGEELHVSGMLFSPLNTVNKVKVSRFGRTAKVKMTQAMLREGGSRRFSVSVPIPSKVDQVVVGDDTRKIWSRAEGILIDTSDTSAQADRATADLERRVQGVMRAFD